MTETDPRLERWLVELLATPGLTSLPDLERAREELLEDSLTAVPHVAAVEGPIADVGSGGGAPGVPLAAAFPERAVTLIEASRRKCDFLVHAAAAFPNVEVVCGRAEEQQTEQFGVVVAKALAPPPVALEWCLPLARVGGAVVLFVGRVEADLEGVSKQLGGGAPVAREVVGSVARQLLVVPKIEPTPSRFPRRPGVAKRRPLA